MSIKPTEDGAAKIAQFYSLLKEIVDSPGNWLAKRDALIRAGTPEDQGKLREFTSWFHDEEF